MRFRISYSEIQSLMDSKNINLFFKPSGLREARVGISPLLSIPVEISVLGDTLRLQYSSGGITGLVVNSLVGLFSKRFGNIDFILDDPGVLGLNLASIPNADKVFNLMAISDVFFEDDSLIVEGVVK